MFLQIMRQVFTQRQGVKLTRAFPRAVPVAELFRSFNRILCTKGEYPWERNKRQNLDMKLCVLQ